MNNNVNDNLGRAVDQPIHVVASVYYSMPAYAILYSHRLFCQTSRVYRVWRAIKGAHPVPWLWLRYRYEYGQAS